MHFLAIIEPNYIKMSKNRKITSQEFEYLSSLEPYVAKNDANNYKTLKYTLLDDIESVFGDKWFNLKDSTRKAIDYIVFLSLERGFVYASPDHIAKRYKIARSTVYEALKVLREEQIVYKANRSSRKQNGLGCSVHIFVNHPYFDHIRGYLNLEWNSQEKANQKAEESEIPCQISVESDSNPSTLSLPTLNQQHIDLHLNVQDQSHVERKSIIKYVPKEINEIYAGIFNFRLRFIWQKITQAWKTIRHASLDRGYLIDTGKRIIKRIYQIWKEHIHQNLEMTVDAMCAFAYKATRDMIYGALASEYMEYYDADENNMLGEAVRSIPEYENICMRVYPEYDYNAMKDYVLNCLKWGFRMLSPDAIQRITDHYDRYTYVRNDRYALCS